jgi:hypothetical protein
MKPYAGRRYRFTAPQMAAWLTSGLGWSDIAKLVGGHHTTVLAAARRLGVDHLIQPGKYRTNLGRKGPWPSKPHPGQWPTGIHFEDAHVPRFG